ncbi:MAG TPA: hypothetical protein VGD64_03930, partial [Acidisarcina sp.]
MTQSESLPLLSYEEAAAIVRLHAEELRGALTGHGAECTENVALLESQGRVLAEAVVADRDQPPFRRATRDGFACRAADVGGP